MVSCRLQYATIVAIVRMKGLSKILQSFTNSDGGSDRVVGIDIGSSSIKVVELENKKGTISLVTYGELQTGPYAGQEIGQSVILDVKQEQAAMIDVLRESAVQAKQAVFSMSLASSFVTNINFEAEDTANLESRVRVEARKVIPVSLSEVALDWAEVEFERDKDEKDTTRSIMIAAIQNDSLQRFRVLMQFVGLPNPPTEIECFSAIRSLYNSNESHMAVVDIGAQSAKMYIAHNGMLARMHRLRAGGALVTKRLAGVLEQSFEAVELTKRTITRDDERFRDVQRAHISCYERSFSEFRQVIREYEQRSGITLDVVYLTGGGGVFPGVQSKLQDELGTEVLKANPFSKVAYPAFMEDTMFSIGPSFVVAIGAALRQFE